MFLEERLVRAVGAVIVRHTPAECRARYGTAHDRDLCPWCNLVWTYTMTLGRNRRKLGKSLVVAEYVALVGRKEGDARAGGPPSCGVGENVGERHARDGPDSFAGEVSDPASE